MKYGLISLGGFLFITVICSSQGQASGQWSESQPSIQQKKESPWQRFKNWREDRSSRKKQNQPSNFTQSSPTEMFNNMCDTICKPPRACQLSEKEVAYCNQKCGGQIDLKGCLSDSAWAIVRQKMTGTSRQSFEEGSSFGGREEQLKELERRGNIARDRRNGYGDNAGQWQQLEERDNIARDRRDQLSKYRNKPLPQRTDTPQGSYGESYSSSPLPPEDYRQYPTPPQGLINRYGY